MTTKQSLPLCVYSNGGRFSANCSSLLRTLDTLTFTHRERETCKDTHVHNNLENAERRISSVRNRQPRKARTHAHKRRHSHKWAYANCTLRQAESTYTRIYRRLSRRAREKNTDTLRVHVINSKKWMNEVVFWCVLFVSIYLLLLTTIHNTIALRMCLCDGGTYTTR